MMVVQIHDENNSKRLNIVKNLYDDELIKITYNKSILADDIN